MLSAGKLKKNLAFPLGSRNIALKQKNRTGEGAVF
jgi:hypothetical protein